MLRTWHIVTGEYPPQPGGIADYTSQGFVAALRARGEEVHVWTPPFGLTELRAIGRGVDASRSSGATPILLVQYAPNAFGMRGANVPFCLWLLLRAWRHEDDIRVMFHEPFSYFARQPLRRNLLALVQRVMAALLLASSRIAYSLDEFVGEPVVALRSRAACVRVSADSGDRSSPGLGAQRG